MPLSEALRLAQENAFRVKVVITTPSPRLRAPHREERLVPTLGVTGNVLEFHPQDPLASVRPDPAAWNEVYATNVRLSYPICTEDDG